MVVSEQSVASVWNNYGIFIVRDENWTENDGKSRTVQDDKYYFGV